MAVHIEVIRNGLHSMDQTVERFVGFGKKEFSMSDARKMIELGNKLMELAADIRRDAMDETRKQD